MKMAIMLGRGENLFTRLAAAQAAMSGEKKQ